jgi:hypothetical protein
VSAPIAGRYTGEGFEILPRFRAQADREFVIGEVYTLAEIEERSGAAHRWFFVAVKEAWANLPEHLTDQFRSPDALRKFALIRAGFANSQQYVCATRGEAIRLAAALGPVDPYAVVTVEGCVVTRFTAKSQSYKAMPKGEFKASMDGVMEVLERMIGTQPGVLEDHARAA